MKIDVTKRGKLTFQYFDFIMLRLFFKIMGIANDKAFRIVFKIKILRLRVIS